MTESSGETRLSDREEFWLVYYSDFSEFYVFDSEIEALRCAVANSAQVRRVPFNVGVQDFLR